MLCSLYAQTDVEKARELGREAIQKMDNGDEDAFVKWEEANQDKWETFVEWFTENPLVIDEEHKFHREQY